MPESVLHQIGYYQFDNLIRSRVPFYFINFAQDISNWYESIYKTHLQDQQFLLKAEDVEKFLKSKNVPQDFALVIACQNGQLSDSVSQRLLSIGYKNVYCIDGGIQQMMTDRGSL